jgi:hypothetical protein
MGRIALERSRDMSEPEQPWTIHHVKNYPKLAFEKIEQLTRELEEVNEKAVKWDKLSEIKGFEGIPCACQIDDFGNQVRECAWHARQRKELQAEVERLRGIVGKFIHLVSPNGEMNGMASQSKRLDFFGKARELRLEAEALQSSDSEKGDFLENLYRGAVIGNDSIPVPVNLLKDLINAWKAGKGVIAYKVVDQIEALIQAHAGETK